MTPSRHGVKGKKFLEKKFWRSKFLTPFFPGGPWSMIFFYWGVYSPGRKQEAETRSRKDRKWKHAEERYEGTIFPLYSVGDWRYHAKEARKTVTPPSEGHHNIRRHQRNSPPGTIVPHYLSLGRINGDLGEGDLLFIARNSICYGKHNYLRAPHPVNNDASLCVFLPL